jgi:hypothetical protein
MNYFSKIKIGTWIVIILTIVNLASLATIFYKTSCNLEDDRKLENRRPQKPKEGGFHWKQLNLTPEQETKFKAMGKIYFDSVRVIYHLRDSLAIQIANELKKDKPNIATMYEYSSEMGENYARSKRLTIDHLIDLKKQCRADQVHKLDSMYHFLLIGFEKPRHGRPESKSKQDSIQKLKKPTPDKH